MGQMMSEIAHQLNNPLVGVVNLAQLAELVVPIHGTRVTDINTGNVSKLQMIWLQGTNALRGHEGQPLVIKDGPGGKPILFMVSGCPSMANCNVVQALDLSDPDHPKEIWNYVKKTDRDESAVPRACCDTVNRGGSYADGKFVYGTLDGFLIALDGQTGKEVWVVKHAWPEHGETITPAPLIADDKVIIGFGGDAFNGEIVPALTELVDAGVDLRPGQIRDSNRHTLLALLARP